MNNQRNNSSQDEPTQVHHTGNFFDEEIERKDPLKNLNTRNISIYKGADGEYYFNQPSSESKKNIQQNAKTGMMEPVQTAKQKKKRRKPLFYFFDAILEISITLFIIVVLFMGYSLWFTGLETRQAQKGLHEQVEQLWQEPSPYLDYYDEITSASDGEPIAIMRIPAIRPDWQYVVQKGTNLQDIKNGPGWYKSTQLPGQKGNFAVAGHEAGYNAPFEEIWYTMNVCDDIFVETRDKIFTYKVFPKSDNPQEIEQFKQCAPNIAKRWEERYKNAPIPVYGVDVIHPSNSSILRPIPKNEEFDVPNYALPIVTLQTCHPHLQNWERAMIRGGLVSEEVKPKDRVIIGKDPLPPPPEQAPENNPIENQ